MSELSTSTYSSVLNVTGFGEFPWLKDPLDPTNNMEFEITGDEFSWEEDIDKATFTVLSRRIGVTVSDGPKGAVFSGFTASLVTKEEEDKFDALWFSGHTLLLQLPDGRQWFILFDKRKKRLPPGTGPFMYVDIAATETDEPDVLAQ